MDIGIIRTLKVADEEGFADEITHIEPRRRHVDKFPVYDEYFSDTVVVVEIDEDVAHPGVD